MPTSSLDSQCRPRWATARTAERATLGPQVVAVARALGYELLPHQQLVLDVGLEIDPETGRFAYRDVTVTEPRQGGKSTRMLSLAVWRATVYAAIERRLQVVAYSAQSGFDARRKMLDDWVPIIEHSELYPLVDAIRRGAGHEVIEFTGGSRMQPIANTVGSGHGRVLDLGLIDEAFDDTDDRREQAIVPAMASRANAQLWVTSTAGTADAIYLKRKVEHGRQLAEADVRHGSAYFEWSARPDDDLDDPRAWATFMPALSSLVGLEAVQHARDTMTDHEFARAFGNVWTTTEQRVIPWADWVACRSTEAAPDGGLYFAVDAPPERTSAVIVAASYDGVSTNVELIDKRDGLGWVSERIVQLVQHHDARAVVLHGAGPIGTLAAELERAIGSTLYVLTDSDMTLAAGTMFDAIVDHRLRVRWHQALDDAVVGARKRARGDAFTWARRNAGVDLSPLVAATLAVWKASNGSEGALWLYG